MGRDRRKGGLKSVPKRLSQAHCSGNRLSPCLCKCAECTGALDPTLTDDGDPPVRVTCGYVDENLTAYITELALGQNNLVGAIPASIGNLSSKLSTLGIFYNPGPSARPNRVLVCVVRTLNPIGQARVTLSPRYEQLRAVHGPRQEGKGPEIRPKRFPQAWLAPSCRPPSGS